MGSFLQYNGLPVLAALASLSLPAAPGERLWRLYFLGSLADAAERRQAGRVVELLARADRRDGRAAGAGQPSSGRLAAGRA